MIVTTTYLHQLSRAEVVPSRRPAPPMDVALVGDPAPEFCRFLYTAVGGDWFWTDWLGWSLQQWTDWLSRPGVETWVGWVNGAPAGYLQLDPAIEEDRTHVEIAYFGVLSRYLGRGLGGHLLTEGLTRAWDVAERCPALPAVSRVWVHTCSLDGPAALANYQARGLQIYRTVEEEQSVPAESPGPWPGAR